MAGVGNDESGSEMGLSAAETLRGVSPLAPGRHRISGMRKYAVEMHAGLYVDTNVLQGLYSPEDSTPSK